MAEFFLIGGAFINLDRIEKVTFSEPQLSYPAGATIKMTSGEILQMWGNEDTADLRAILVKMDRDNRDGLSEPETKYDGGAKSFHERSAQSP